MSEHGGGEAAVRGQPVGPGFVRPYLLAAVLLVAGIATLQAWHCGWNQRKRYEANTTKDVPGTELGDITSTFFTKSTIAYVTTRNR
jgi:hypothetical protein